ncbi:MAG: glucose-6-phosphate isomerase, partial [Clostridia bacterium]|nr:glucose-6-phosphate isomerase [Clostridia bacterium]
MAVLKLNETFAKQFVTDGEMEQVYADVKRAYGVLASREGAGNDFLGWVDLPENYDKEEFDRILVAAEKIKKSCDVLVVIGIGGSYLGARAVIEFVKSPLYNNMKKDTPDVYFAGNSISAAALTELLSICEGKDICVNVISKSGTTTEPAVAFRVFRSLLEEKYGVEGARERIFVTTDKARGTLKAFSTERGYETFVVPDDVGGRFSVLTAVGLLPIAVAGISVSDLMAGAAAARQELCNDDALNNPVLKYAAYRNAFNPQGQVSEIK